MNPRVVEIDVYPIKSLAQVTAQSVRVEPMGLEFDRRWMLVETSGEFITQRTDPSLVRFGIEVTPQCLRVHGTVLPPLEVPLKPAGPLMSIQVWSSRFRAHRVGDFADEWFSKELGRPCHLVGMPEHGPRKVHPPYGDAEVSFADAMPILVVGRATLSELNDRLEEPVPANRFRANIVLDGLPANAEDDCERIEIGGVTLRSTRRCGRCLVVCTDQQTGERKSEPLRTLAEYRTHGKNACMGMYYVPESFGAIEVGAEVRTFGAR